MNYIGLAIDAILSLVALLIVINYTKKGFVKSAFGFFGFFLMVILAHSISKLYRERLCELIEDDVSFISAELSANVLAFTLAMVGTFCFVKLCAIILNYIVESFGLLKGVNHVLGCAVGILVALLWVQILSVILRVGGGFIIERYDLYDENVFEKSLMIEYMYEHNIFKMLFETL